MTDIFLNPQSVYPDWTELYAKGVHTNGIELIDTHNPAISPLILVSNPVAADVGLILTTKGIGIFTINTEKLLLKPTPAGSGVGGVLSLSNPAGTHTTSFEGGASTADFIYILPIDVPAVNDRLTVLNVVGNTAQLAWSP